MNAFKKFTIEVDEKDLRILIGAMRVEMQTDENADEEEQETLLDCTNPMPFTERLERTEKLLNNLYFALK